MAKKPGLRARAKSVQAAMVVAEETDTETGKRVMQSLRMPEDMYEAVRTLAFEQRRSQHSIMLEGVELVLKKYGKG